MIKEVKAHKSTKNRIIGKVYLPKEWIGKKVDVILLVGEDNEV